MLFVEVLRNEKARRIAIWFDKEVLGQLSLMSRKPFGPILPRMQFHESSLDPLPETPKDFFHFLLWGKVRVFQPDLPLCDRCIWNFFWFFWCLFEIDGDDGLITCGFTGLRIGALYNNILGDSQLSSFLLVCCAGLLVDRLGLSWEEGHWGNLELERSYRFYFELLRSMCLFDFSLSLIILVLIQGQLLCWLKIWKG